MSPATDDAPDCRPIGKDPEYRALLACSAAIGRDAALVQAAGGNTSLKRGGVLWVKASGTWLMHAESRPIMVPVRLGALLAAVRAPGDAAERAQDFVIAEQNPAGLRPSIETTMHGVLPHPMVIHVHCVETLAWVARADAEAVLAPLLAGLRWVFIPYLRPGLPLTRAILARIGTGADVLVLGSHGLVVGGRDTASARALLAEVSRRLRRVPRAAPGPDPEALDRAIAGAPYRLATDTAVHGIATDPASRAVAGRGSLYPDHVIFLGPGIVTLARGETARGHTGPMLVVPGAGVLLRRDAPDSVAALARCLADVTARLDPGEPLVALSGEDEAALLGWDAEKYRQSLAR